MKKFACLFVRVLLCGAVLFSAWLLGRAFVLDRITLRGHSMEPSFHAGEKVWVGKLAHRTRGIREGDAVVFSHPSKDYFVCKRCIAAPGDSVRYARTAADTTLFSGILYAPAKGDSVALDSLNFHRYAHAIAFETGSETVWIKGAAFLDGKRLERYRFSCDWYYFLGDNRDHSVDSRHYGLVPKDKVLGIVRTPCSWKRARK